MGDVYDKKWGVTHDQGHHESDQEVRDRMSNPRDSRIKPGPPPPAPGTPQVPPGVSVALKVRIDGNVGSFVGQRDLHWEENQVMWDVTLGSNGKVMLTSGTGDSKRVITLDPDGLAAAVKILQDYKR